MLAPELQDLANEIWYNYGNASSIHQSGQRARRLVNEAREIFSDLLKCHEKNLVFSSCATESINTILKSAFLPLNLKKNHLIVSAVEHSAVLEVAKNLQSQGVELSVLSVDAKGDLDLEELRSLIKNETALIAVMYANNETGKIFPIRQVGEIARELGIPFLCDAVQVAGKYLLDLEQLPVDFLVASAHKFHGPKGVGLLYFHPEQQLKPLLLGGRQERGYRAGTENTHGIYLAAKAFEIAHKDLNGVGQLIGRMRHFLYEGLLEKIPDLKLTLDLDSCLLNTLHFRVPGISGESLLLNLDMAGIEISVGSACDSGSLEPSHVLMAMGFNPQEAMEGLRFSLSRYNTSAEIESSIEIISRIVEDLRNH